MADPFRFYVYTHARNDTREVIYVGKGTGRRARTRHGRSELWARTEAKYGVTVSIIADGLTEQQAFALEIAKIAELSPACNFTTGGEGMSGYRHSEQTKEALRLAHAGKKQPAELIERRAAALRGKKRTPEQRAKFVFNMLGKKHSEQTRARMSAAHTGRARSAAVIARTAAKHIGAKRSAEARRNMSDAQPKRAVRRLSDDTVFPSLTAAAQWLRNNGFPKATKTGVWAAASGKARTAYGDRWVFTNDGADA